MQSLHEEIDAWFSKYFETFIAISAGKADAREILAYWSVPLHTSSPNHAKWLKSPEEVVGVLVDLQRTLSGLGYTHTVAIAKAVTAYNANAGRVATIMSRRNAGGEEVDRAAVAFEVRKFATGWLIISTVACPTTASEL